MRPPCMVDDCDNVSRARRLCEKHYQRWKGGVWQVDAPLVSTRKYPTIGTCSVDDCGRRCYTKGMCRKHYAYNARNGTPQRGPFINLGNDCSVDGCDKPAITRGYCHAHYKRWCRRGDPLSNHGHYRPALQRRAA